jgi:hypothetical protein
MKSNRKVREILADPILMTGLLPLLPGVKTFAAGCFLAMGLIIISVLLQLVASGSSHLLLDRPWKMSILFVAAVLTPIVEGAIGLADPARALALSHVFPFLLYAGIMRQQYSGWKEGVEAGIHYDPRSLLPVLLSSILLLAFSLFREILGRGTLTLPAFGSQALRFSVPPFAWLPSQVFSFSAGAFILAGYLAVLLRVFGSRAEAGKDEKA